jgi:hypothetical protein
MFPLKKEQPSPSLVARSLDRFDGTSDFFTAMDPAVLPRCADRETIRDFRGLARITGAATSRRRVGLGVLAAMELVTLSRSQKSAASEKEQARSSTRAEGGIRQEPEARLPLFG